MTSVSKFNIVPDIEANIQKFDIEVLYIRLSKALVGQDSFLRDTAAADIPWDNDSSSNRANVEVCGSMSRQTACFNSKNMIGCTSLPAESGILRTDLVGDGSGYGYAITRSNESGTTATPSTSRSASRGRHRRPTAMGSWARWHSS